MVRRKWGWWLSCSFFFAVVVWVACVDAPSSRNRNTKWPAAAPRHTLSCWGLIPTVAVKIVVVVSRYVSWRLWQCFMHLFWRWFWHWFWRWCHRWLWGKLWVFDAMCSCARPRPPSSPRLGPRTRKAPCCIRFCQAPEVTGELKYVECPGFPWFPWFPGFLRINYLLTAARMFWISKISIISRISEN